MKKYLAVISELIIVLMLSVVSNANASGPASCPAAIGQAIAKADATSFERLVDVDVIIVQAIDLFLTEMRKPDVSRKMPPMLALLFASNQGSAIRSLLLTESKNFVLAGVSSGAFAGRPSQGKTAQGLLAPLFADASKGRKEIRNIGQPLKSSDGWLVPFEVHDFGNGLDYPVLGRIVHKEGQWRLASIENMADIFSRIQAEAE